MVKTEQTLSYCVTNNNFNELIPKSTGMLVTNENTNELALVLEITNYFPVNTQNISYATIVAKNNTTSDISRGQHGDNEYPKYLERLMYLQRVPLPYRQRVENLLVSLQFAESKDTAPDANQYSDNCDQEENFEPIIFDNETHVLNDNKDNGEALGAIENMCDEILEKFDNELLVTETTSPKITINKFSIKRKQQIANKKKIKVEKKKKLRTVPPKRAQTSRKDVDFPKMKKATVPPRKRIDQMYYVSHALCHSEVLDEEEKEFYLDDDWDDHPRSWDSDDDY